MLTLTHLVGMFVAALAGALAGEGVARAWPLARLGPFGAMVLGACVAAPAAYLLQLFGAGSIGLRSGLGLIDWIPVLSLVATGAACAAIVVTTVGLMRIGGRRDRRRR